MIGIIIPEICPGSVINPDLVKIDDRRGWDKQPHRIQFYGHFDVDIGNIKKGEQVVIYTYVVPKSEWTRTCIDKEHEVPVVLYERDSLIRHKKLEEIVMNAIATEKIDKMRSGLKMPRDKDFTIADLLN